MPTLRLDAFTTQEGATALHIAAHFNHPARAAMLIKAGASLTALDGHQRTPLMRAQQADNPGCEPLILAAEAAAATAARERQEAQEALLRAVQVVNQRMHECAVSVAVDSTRLRQLSASGADEVTAAARHWELTVEISEELRKQLRCHLPAAQGTEAASLALKEAAMLKGRLAEVRCTLAEVTLRRAISAAEAERQQAAAANAAGAEDPAGAGMALVALKAAITDHSAALGDSCQVLRQARALRDAMVEGIRREREEARAHVGSAVLELPQLATPASLGLAP